MRLAAGRTRMVKRIRPAPLLRSPAPLLQLPCLGREPSSPQAGNTPSTDTLHMAGQGKAEPPPAPPAYNTTRKQPRSPGLAQALAPGRESTHRNPRGCCNWLQTTGPASWFEFSLCLQKKRKILNGLLIFIQHCSEGSSSYIKIHHRCFASLQ